MTAATTFCTKSTVRSDGVWPTAIRRISPARPAAHEAVPVGDVPQRPPVLAQVVPGLGEPLRDLERDADRQRPADDPLDLPRRSPETTGSDRAAVQLRRPRPTLLRPSWKIITDYGTKVRAGSRASATHGYSRSMIVDRLDMTGVEFHRLTGWEIKPEGACKDDRCVPLVPPVRDDRWPDRPRCGHGASRHADGPRRDARTVGDRRLSRAAGCSRARACPMSCFPTSVDQPFDVATLRGRKVLLLAWASW